MASGVSRKPDDGRGVIRSDFAFVGANCDSVRHLFRRLRRHLPLKGKDLGVELVRFLRPSKRAARKIPPLEGRVASGVPRSRMTEEVIFVALLHPSKQTAIRYDTSSVACGDTFPSRGRTWEWNSFRFCVHRSGLHVKSLPSRGGWHPASHASRMTEEVIFVALLHPSKQTAIR